jgi:hypothetical protein
MKFSLWTQYGALNSKSVFDAFRTGLCQAGHVVVENDPTADVDVIWSVLWAGRMARNKDIWERARTNNKPVIVLEVGGIQRGTTWKVGLNGINRDAYFGPTNNNDDRARKLGLTLTPWRSAGEYILVCGQHEQSQQWQNMPRINEWLTQTIKQIRNYSDKKIVIRPHPRCPIMSVEAGFKNVIKQQPLKRTGSYDDYDIRFNGAHAVVSWSSNPGIHATLKGIPAFVGPSSLAFDVANHDLKNIENPLMLDRSQWLNDYAYTEWTLQEIAEGIPLKRLTDRL